MGAQQSQQQGQQEKRRLRKRDYLIGMCINQLGSTEQNDNSKLRKSLSENMKSQSQDILTYYEIEIFQENERGRDAQISHQNFTVFLDFLDNKRMFLTQTGQQKTKVHSRDEQQHLLKLSQLILFKKALAPMFCRIWITLEISFLLKQTKTNPGSGYIQTIKEACNTQQYSLRQQMRIIEEEIQKTFNIEYSLVDKILEICRNPVMPIPLLTDDILKQCTTSWFQLELAQRATDYTAIEKVPSLDELTENLYQDCLHNFNVTNMKHTQLLFELRWVVIDNFLKDPSILDSDNIPLLMRLLLNIFYFVYQRCLFSRNVLFITKTEKNPAMFLSMYTILWESYVGQMWALNRVLKKIFCKIDLLFDEYFTTTFPKITFTSALARLWSQVVLKGTKNSEMDTIEYELFYSYEILLQQKRIVLQQFYMKNHYTQEQQVIGKKFYNDDYFNYCPSAVNYLLNKFTSNILDLSLHEQSINWIGHSNVKVGSLYGKIIEIVMQQANDLYSKASESLSTDYQVYKNYIIADSKYMQEILNQWTVQVCLLPKGIEYLYEKIKINLRQYVINCQLNQQIQEQPQHHHFEDNVLESKIIGQNVQQLQLNEQDENVSHNVDRYESTLENIICEIQREEKIQQKEQDASYQNTKQNQQQSVFKQPSYYQYSFAKHQSILESDFNKTKMLSTYTSSTRVSQITQLNSVYSQQIMSSYKSNYQMNQIKEIKIKLEQNQWVMYLKDICNIENENQIKIEKRNNQIQLRNNLRKIPLELEEHLNNNIEFTKVWSLEDTMSLFESKNTMNQFEGNNPERNFSEMKVGKGLLASYFIQHQI